ncbi:MAG: type II toxin-antitoxin system HigB family toxin [Spirosomataceae bacterium]
MRIFSRGTLRTFWEQHQDAQASLEFWYDTVENMDFENPNQVIAYFNEADKVGNGRVVFNIAHNKYRLIAKFEYERKFVFVRFIGTHKEYDKIQDIANI